MSLDQDTKVPDVDGYEIVTLANGHVEIRLGDIHPFEIHKDTAIKFGLIMLKRAGALVTLTETGAIVLFKGSRKSN